MKNPQLIHSKIFDLPELKKQVSRWRLLGKKIAFTNGCFDILHQGHIYSLSEAAKEADVLVVGVNADSSVQKLKGRERPVNDQHSRSLILASLVMTDAVILFEEDTPHHLITNLLPDVIVKGGDYTVEQVVGSTEVIANGGRVVINKIIQGFSTTGLIDKIQRL
jgi:D-beta-D-heptose 7-phosphate kinase/D-beta-D-heptose 1-phosphate adenosyltransferase